MYCLHAKDHFNCSHSFSHDQHHKTDAAKRKGVSQRGLGGNAQSFPYRCYWVSIHTELLFTRSPMTRSFVRGTKKVQKEVRPQLHTLALRWATLARCGRSSHIQALGDSVQVLSWPGTGLPVWDMYTDRSSCWATVSSFRQPLSCCSNFCWTFSAVTPLSLDQRHGTCSVIICVKRICISYWLYLSDIEGVPLWTLFSTSIAFETLHHRNWHWHTYS